MIVRQSWLAAIIPTRRREALPHALLKFVGRNDDSIMDYAASFFDSTVGSGSGRSAAMSLGMST